MAIALFTIGKTWQVTQVPMDGWITKRTVVYTHNGLLFSLVKEGNADICYDVDEPWVNNVKWNKPFTKTHECCMIPLIRGTLSRQKS